MGQDHFETGYVVLHKNDTLHGYVKDRKNGPFGEIYQKIRFRGEGMRKRFSPKDIIAYKKGPQWYRTKYLDGKKEFLKVVQEGKVFHYVFEFQEQGEELIHEVNYFKKPNSVLIRADQGLFGLRRKKLIQYFYDCPPLIEKLEKKQLKSAYEVAEFYNRWIGNQKNQ